MWTTKNVLQIVYILSCREERIWFQYALFVECAIFVKSLMVYCFGFHGSINWDNVLVVEFVNQTWVI